MTVDAETNRVSYDTDGVETEFDFSFEIHADSWLLLRFQPTGGSWSNLVLNTDYTVSRIAGELGGTVTTLNVYPAGTLRIIRIPPNRQETEYEHRTALYSGTLESDTDIPVIQNISQQEQIDRALKFDIASTTEDITVPEPESNKVLGWNAAGDGLENKTPDALGLTAALDDLTDVDVSTPAVGDMARYDGSNWVKTKAPTVDSIELIKSGNSPGDNGNCRFVVSGDDLKLQSRVGGSWEDTGIAWTIA